MQKDNNPEKLNSSDQSKCFDIKRAQIEKENQRFKNIAEVIRYLHEEGWSASKRKIYYDRNKINRQPDGSFLKTAVDKYAKLFLSRTDRSKDISAAEKLKWEIEVTRQKAEKLRHENEIERGIYLLRSDVEHMLAARAAYLKDNLGAAFIYSRAAEIILLVKGDQTYMPDLTEYWLCEMGKVFNYYAKPMQFEVPYRPLKTLKTIDEEDNA